MAEIANNEEKMNQVVLIQSQYRGVQERKKVKKLKLDKMENEIREDPEKMDKIIKIQASYRGKRDRQAVSQMERAPETPFCGFCRCF